MHINDLLKIATDRGASDLHLKVGSYPVIRVHGNLLPLTELKRLMQEDTIAMAFSIMSGRQKQKFKDNYEIDIAYSVPGLGRFRCNIFQQRGTVGLVLRVIPIKIRTFTDLELPGVLKTICEERRGMILCTGTTGSGKSTTLAAMIDYVNSTRTEHVMTIEDPIEFLHRDKKSLINQREVEVDTKSFAQALRSALRQDPDVILVGELRDLETIAVALTAAETGHLVLATLHTQSAQDTISRVVDVFPAEQQQQIRTQLAATLQAVVCQTLVRTADQTGRVAAVEIMVCNSGIRAMIRDDKLPQIPGALQAGAKDGMQTLNAHLADLVRTHKITLAEAIEHCSNKEDLLTLTGSTLRRPPAQLRASEVPLSI